MVVVYQHHVVSKIVYMYLEKKNQSKTDMMTEIKKEIERKRNVSFFRINN